MRVWLGWMGWEIAGTKKIKMIKTYFKGIKNVLLENILTAEDEIIIAVAWFTNHELFNALCEKLAVGVNVNLCLVNDEINNRVEGLNFDYFLAKGGVLYFGKSDELMHHKFCIIDNKILFNGSYNWTYYAENKNRENIIMFRDFPEIILDFRNEFINTVSKCDEIFNISSYLIENKPNYSQDLSNYISYDILYQAKYNEKSGNFVKAKSLAEKSLLFKKDNKETQLVISRVEVKQKLITTEKSNQIDKNDISIENILKTHERELLSNYISLNPDRQKAYSHAIAIYEYEKPVNFINANKHYNSVNPGYLLMVFGEYQKANEFFLTSTDALGLYDQGILQLLLNNYKDFSTKLNQSLKLLENKDQPCSALYIPSKSKGFIEFSEKKQTDINSKDTVSLKEIILKIKNEFNI